MPLFEYRCKVCGKEFEYLHIPGRDETAECPECGSSDINKLLSAFNSTGNSAELKPFSNSHEPCCGASNPCDNPKRCCSL